MIIQLYWYGEYGEAFLAWWPEMYAKVKAWGLVSEEITE